VVEEIFRDSSNVELLQWFSRGSLKQNLTRSIRLLVWLRSLYGEAFERLPLDDAFTYAELRDVFFTPTHPKGEEIPPHHDPKCPCAKTAKDLLFSKKTNISENQWKHSIIQQADIRKSELEKLLEKCPFKVTRRSLQGDVEILGQLGWLKYKNQKYYRVDKFPFRPGVVSESRDKLATYELNFLHEDLTTIVENHSRQINDVQRFILKLDYVIPKSTIDLVENWQYELKQIWAQTPVPPIKLHYNSARVGNSIDCIIYPVCIYYVQRAIYLCGYGESPDRHTEWYNFRLDRIEEMIPLQWTDKNLPISLQKRYQKSSLPNPDEIGLKMTQALGFDFYLPSQLALLRFDRDYHDRYIKNTIRHETFEEISYQQAKRLIQRQGRAKNSNLQQLQQQKLLQILEQRSPSDAYYQLFIRYQDNQNRDNNVIMRLRAWRPKCEVLLPWDLRKEIAADIKKESKLYAP
jgi:CRISPR-associated protein (TIGR03985 family)